MSEALSDRRRASILLVECHGDLAASMADALRAAAFDVVAVPDSLAALKVLRRRAPVDVLVTRVRMCSAMPHGFALARMARHSRPRLKVLYMTRFEVPDIERENAPATILDAPVEPERLVHEVSRLVGP